MISVVVPVFNVEKYLNTCIESILKQSYSDLDVILVDDGSTDGSEKICDEWAQRDRRIRVIHKENGGLSDARNKGIDLAKGEFITFIDSDDFIMTDYFQCLYNLLVTSKADMSVCQMVKVNEKNEIIGVDKQYPSKIIEGRVECMYYFLFDNAIDTTAWRKLYRIELFSKDEKIRYPKGVYHEDVYTTYRLIAKCNKIAVSDKRLYAYRIRYGSIVNSSFSPKHLDGIKGSIEKYEYIKEYFPSIKYLATKGIIYSANKCLFRIASIDNPSRVNNYITYLKSIYKLYIWEYLKTNAKIKSKIFAIIARINISFFLRILKYINTD